MLYWMKQQESIIKISSEKNWTMMPTRSAMKSGRYNELGDERQNLNKDVNGVIIAFGDLGLWNGRKQGYQILGDNIAGILQSTQYDAEWYGDGYDIRGRMSHHDGTNYVLYRVAENRDDAERIAAKIYNYEIDENGFRQVTRSLHPYVAAVYGWKTLQDNLVQVK